MISDTELSNLVITLGMAATALIFTYHFLSHRE